AHILLPTDFSDNALHASSYAAHLFGREDNVYTLMHAYIDMDPALNSWPGMADEIYKASMIGMSAWADRVRAMPEFANAVVRTEVLYGALPEMLNSLAKEKRADIVVMGTLGSSGNDMLGSNAGEVVKHSKVPVLVVPNRAEIKPVKRILYADGEQHVEVAGSRMLIDIALRTKAEVILAHVLKNADEVPDPNVVAMYEELLQAVPHRFTSREGKDIAGVIDFLSDQEKADMVVVLHHHTGFLESLFHTSAAKRLAMHTHIPLLVLQQLDPQAEG
ncbi:MAG: universal stress protein, partial [Flavobacteriales bacterium]